ncbi:MAG: 4Fe-4S binding protein [Deltaproteobacteria bacterium]|nr:4Fe-4S binding protein [Deltaproteobacteria bacterium]
MRLRRLFQGGMSVGANGYLRGFFAGTLYQGPGKGICVPVLNCYACPSAFFSCPIGTIQHFMAVHAFPLYALGYLSLIGLFVGRMSCGILCPFGFLQDLLYKVPSSKIRIPRFARGFRFVALGGLVFVIPWLTHESWFSKLCPAGTLQGGIPWVFLSAEIRYMVGGLFWLKIGILLFFLLLSIVARRPFCQTTCPLGALYGPFNRVSLLRLDWDRATCTRCDKCLEVCPMEIKVYEAPNTGHCIRCLDCTSCPSIRVTTALAPARSPAPATEAA